MFNTEALKFSIKRLNQLGYFKPLEGGKDVNVEKTPGVDNKVDVKLKLEEQNRNQLTFGAGVSEFEGVLRPAVVPDVELPRPRRKPDGVAAGGLARAELLARRSPSRSCSTATSRGGAQHLPQRHPLHRPVHAASRPAASLTFGLPLGRGFTRMFTNYSYERVRVTEINEVYTDPTVLARNPFLRDSLLHRPERRAHHQQGHAEHRLQHGRPADLPDHRQALDARRSISPGIGGNTNFYKPMVEGGGIPAKQNNRMSLGMRGQAEYIHAVQRHRRSCRSSRSCSSAANTASAASTSARSVRRIRRHRPRARRQQEPAVQRRGAVHDCRAGAADSVLRCRPGAAGHRPSSRTRLSDIGAFNTYSVPGKRFAMRDFKTSTGARNPVLHAGAERAVPADFRFQPAAAGRTATTSCCPQKAFQFRFAVGSTF